MEGSVSGEDFGGMDHYRHDPPRFVDEGTQACEELGDLAKHPSDAKDKALHEMYHDSVVVFHENERLSKELSAERKTLQQMRSEVERKENSNHFSDQRHYAEKKKWQRAFWATTGTAVPVAIACVAFAASKHRIAFYPHEVS